MIDDKFIWQEGDVHILDEEEFNKKAILYDKGIKFPCKSCHNVKNCVSCSVEEQKAATVIANKIYDTFFNSSSNDKLLLQKVITSFSNLCKRILVDENLFTIQLYCCSKMNLFDMLIANGKYTEEQIKNVFN